MYNVNIYDEDDDNKSNNDTFEDVCAYFPGTVLWIVRAGSLLYV